MKKLFFFIAIALVSFACTESKTVTVTVTNPTAMERAGEMPGEEKTFVICYLC